MSEYAKRFVGNKIDVSVLPHLTDQDLKDIGVPLLLDRGIHASPREATSIGLDCSQR
jgi:SAM (Sterile alpha motif) domain-containing protein